VKKLLRQFIEKHFPNLNAAFLIVAEIVKTYEGGAQPQGDK
jgi:hypothetical protein